MRSGLGLCSKVDLSQHEINGIFSCSLIVELDFEYGSNVTITRMQEKSYPLEGS